MKKELADIKVNPDPFLDGAQGVVHAGAHHGEERYEYAKRGLRVLWIEADPGHMLILRANLRGFHRQKCFQALLGAESESRCAFHISTNDGASSSVHSLEEHRLLWPEIQMRETIYLPRFTLPQAMIKNHVSSLDYDTLIMDVQGAEMDVLRGIPDLSRRFRQIQLETSDFPLYRGAPIRHEIETYLRKQGFRFAECKVFASLGGQKNCMDCRYVQSC